MPKQKQGSKQGGRAGQRQSTGTSNDELKRREYRDDKGEIHHHTKKYMEEHEGEPGDSSDDSERDEED